MIKYFKKNIILLNILMIMLAQLIISCTPVIIGGGVAATGLALADRRSPGAIADDNFIEINLLSKINNYLKSNKKEGYNNITVVSYNRNVLLIGVLDNQKMSSDIEEITKLQKAVNKVYNHIDIGYNRTNQDYINDKWTSSKIRTALLNAKGYSPNHVKIKTYNSVTYVMGILSPDEQKIVTEEISTISGVKKVVTLYENYNKDTTKNKD